MKQKKRNRLWALVLALVLVVRLLQNEALASTLKSEIMPLANRNLVLNNVTIYEGNLDTDGYHWDANGKTLTLSDSACFGDVILPQNDAVTVVTNGENSFDSLSVKSNDNYNGKMDITISGNGKLTVQNCINDGTDGDTLTVNDGAELIANGGISIGASGGVNSTVIVKGKLSANALHNAIYAGKVIVKNTGELHVSEECGVSLNGIDDNGNIQYDGVFTIEDGGAFYSDCSIYAICVYTGYITEDISDEKAVQIIVLPDLYLPLNYEVRVVMGAQKTSDDIQYSQYGITIAEENAETKFQDGNLIGAADSIKLIPHAHVLTYVAAVPKKCTENGHTEYWICNNCSRIYSDKNGTTQIKLTDTVIPASHTPVHHVAKAASCTEDGNIEYWTCSACGKYFADEACTNVITEEATVVKATGHKIEILNKKEATCTEEGYTGDHVCTVCGEVIQTGISTAKLNHNFKDGKCIICGLSDSDFKPDTEPSSPQTGDNINFMTWIVLLTVSGILFLAVFDYSKKRKNNG